MIKKKLKKCTKKNAEKLSNQDASWNSIDKLLVTGLIEINTPFLKYVKSTRQENSSIGTPKR